jgi:hypothetical protein
MPFNSQRRTVRVPVSGDVVVKSNEGDTQVFVHGTFKRSPNAPHFPEVYEYFSWDAMEHVNLPTVESWINDTSSIN